MPTLSVWAVRLSLLHFAVGTLLGALLLASKAVALPPWLWALRPAHVEALLFGFVIQLAVGVGFWILPRTPTRTRDRPIVVALLLLNVGVGLVAAAAVHGFAVLATLGRLCEAGALAAFAFHAWPRVRATQRHV